MSPYRHEMLDRPPPDHAPDPCEEIRALLAKAEEHERRARLWLMAAGANFALCLLLAAALAMGFGR